MSTRIWEFPRPAWAAGCYSSGPPAGGTPQILVDITSPITERLRVYNLMDHPVKKTGFGTFYKRVLATFSAYKSEIGHYSRTLGLHRQPTQKGAVAFVQWPSAPQLQPGARQGCGGRSRCASFSGLAWRQLYKIGLPLKSILRDYFQENRTSQRPFLLLRISFPGRPIFRQFIPGRSFW